jgi:hypothetical protein
MTELAIVKNELVLLVCSHDQANNELSEVVKTLCDDGAEPIEVNTGFCKVGGKLEIIKADEFLTYEEFMELTK